MADPLLPDHCDDAPADTGTIVLLGRENPVSPEQTELATPKEKTAADSPAPATQESRPEPPAASPADDRPVPSRPGRKKLPLLIGAIAAVLVLVAAFFFFNHKAGPVTLVNKSWENGSLIVTALDSSRLKIQLTDNRPQEYYNGLGTCWMISLKFGEKTETDEPFSIVLLSLASRQKDIDLEESSSSISGTSNLRIWHRIGDQFRDWKTSYVDFFDIEQNENTYCAVIEVPEWFDVSLAEDLTQAMVNLASASGEGEWKNVLSSDAFEVSSQDDPLSNAQLKSSGACGNGMTYQLNADGTLIISGQGKMYDFADSRYVPVPWRTYRDDITSVTLEEGITSIGDYAFYDFRNLTSVSLPASIVEIRSLSFRGCSSLSEITIPENVTFIGDHAFYACDSLSTVTVPASVTEIAEFAFSGGSGIKDIYVLNPTCTIAQHTGTLGLAGVSTIHGYSGSTAQTYAERYHYDFSEITN